MDGQDTGLMSRSMRSKSMRSTLSRYASIKLLLKQCSKGKYNELTVH